MLANNGGDLLTLKQFGGWKSSSVAEQYVEESVSKKIKVSKQLFHAEPEKSEITYCANNENRENPGQNCTCKIVISGNANCTINIV
jgi:hypothetical protein